MLKHQTILPCSHRTAALVFTTIGILFVLTGCAQLYRSIGLDEQQVAAQVASDQTVITAVLDTARTSTTQIVTTALAGLGAILSGFMAKWLGTERKLTKALITGVEQGDQSAVKGAIQKQSRKLGVQKTLAKRVQALT